jgi:hypothetical protein
LKEKGELIGDLKLIFGASIEKGRESVLNILKCFSGKMEKVIEVQGNEIALVRKIKEVMKNGNGNGDIK